uniref:Uncharacterized protein n=1 Tax=Anguilla anguilla TaxID=7936 RepID=A0A0E9WCI0_ANGAN
MITNKVSVLAWGVPQDCPTYTNTPSKRNMPTLRNHSGIITN